MTTRKRCIRCGKRKALNELFARIENISEDVMASNFVTAYYCQTCKMEEALEDLDQWAEVHEEQELDPWWR